MRIERVNVRNFKAIKHSEVPLGDYNIIIGKNDVGKSSLLEAIAMLLNFDVPERSDFYMRDDENTITIHAEFADVTGELLEALGDDYREDDDFNITVTYEGTGGRTPDVIQINGEELEEGAIVQDGDNQSKSNSRSFIQNHLSDTVPVIAERDFAEQTDLKQGSFLTKLMNPVFGSETIGDKTSEIQTEIEQEADDIEDEVKRVLSDQHPLLNDVKIEVSEFKLTRAVNLGVQVKDVVNEEWMPLGTRGSGVGNQFILSMMRAYADSQIDDYCVLFEEPENSLHPSAVRKMGRALKDISRNGGQVVLTTHSQSLINSHSNGKLVVATNADGEAEFESVGDEAFRAIEEIGARNSDLLQSDYVLYCEGASDAAVLEVIARDEFADWGTKNITIQPGGGANLEYQLENMKDINQNSGMLLDSDRDSEDGNLGDQTRDLKERAEELDVDCWILKRAELENYFHQDAIEKVLGSSGVDLGPYRDGEQILIDHHNYREGRKVANARSIAEEMYAQGVADDFDEIASYLREVVERIEG